MMSSFITVMFHACAKLSLHAKLMMFPLFCDIHMIFLHIYIPTIWSHDYRSISLNLSSALRSDLVRFYFLLRSSWVHVKFFSLSLFAASWKILIIPLLSISITYTIRSQNESRACHMICQRIHPPLRSEISNMSCAQGE